MFGLFKNKQKPFMKNSDAVLQKEEELIRLIKTLLEKHFGSSFDVGFKKSSSNDPYTRCIEFKRKKGIKLFDSSSFTFEFELKSQETIKIKILYFKMLDNCDFTNCMSKSGIIEIKDIALFIKKISELISEFEFFDNDYKLLKNDI